MKFFGQDHIMRQLDLSLLYIHDNKCGGAFLLRGMSGYGKTELAVRMANYLAGDQYCLYSGETFSMDKFNDKVWVHFIDEVHTIKEQEALYPLIDSGKYVFIFATNHDSILEEALSNRCTSLLFTEYTDEELIQIFNIHSKLAFPEEVVRHIIKISGRNPRIMIKTYANNLYMYYLVHKEEFKLPAKDIILKIDEIHGIKNGLNRVCNAYLEALERLGGRASIKLIASSLRLDTKTLEFEVEPILIYQKKISISNRGRQLCI